MSEMTLPSRPKIRNSSPGALRSSTLPLGHGGSPQYLVLRMELEKIMYNIFVFNFIFKCNFKYNSRVYKFHPGCRT